MNLERFLTNIMQAEFAILWKIHDFIFDIEMLDQLFLKTVSKNPLQDIVIILFPIFLLSWAELGYCHFWIVVLNLITVHLIRLFIAAKIPPDFDNRMILLSDVSSTSYGFPSLESHMSVVILGNILLRYFSTPLLVIFIFLTFFIGFTRLYSKSRFCHQIIGSWITGILGLCIGLYLEKYSTLKRISRTNQHYMMSALGIISLCYMALLIENNESRIINLKKSEFIKVLTTIMDSNIYNQESDGGSNSNTRQYDNISTVIDDENEELENSNNMNTPVKSRKSTSKISKTIRTPRSTAIKQASLRIRKNGASNSNNILNNNQSVTTSSSNIAPEKKDSFYYLQRNLERRSVVQQQQQQQYEMILKSDDELTGGASRGDTEGGININRYYSKHTYRSP